VDPLETFGRLLWIVIRLAGSAALIVFLVILIARGFVRSPADETNGGSRATREE